MNYFRFKHFFTSPCIMQSPVCQKHRQVNMEKKILQTKHTIKVTLPFLDNIVSNTASIIIQQSIDSIPLMTI